MMERNLQDRQTKRPSTQSDNVVVTDAKHEAILGGRLSVASGQGVGGQGQATTAGGLVGGRSDDADVGQLGETSRTLGVQAEGFQTV